MKKHWTRPRCFRLLAASSLAIVLGSCGSSGADPEEQSAAAADSSNESATEVAAESEQSNDLEQEGTDEVAASADEPAPEPVVAGVFDAQEQLFEEQFTDIGAGTYRFNRLGTEFTIQIADPVVVQPNEKTRVVFSSQSSRGPGDDDFILFRPNWLSSPEDLGSQETESWALTDIDGWLDDLPSTVVVTDRRSEELGGVAAISFDLQLAEDHRCGPDACAFFLKSQLDAVWFEKGRFYRVWYVPQGNQSPIFVVVGSSGPDDSWFETVDRLRTGLAFGPAAPHPIAADVVLWEEGLPSDVPAGVVTIPVAGGLTFELDEERFIFQVEGYAAIYPDAPAQNDIFIARSTQAGPIDSIQSGVERLEEHSSIEVIGVEDVMVGERWPAKKVEIEGRSSPVLSWSDPFDEQNIWFPPVFGTVWFIDIGESSPLVVTSETFEGREFLAAPNATAERLLATLELAAG